MPRPDLEAGKDVDFDLLDEDLLQIVDGTRRYTVDVGWYPAGAIDGRFICLLVLDDDWESPLEQIETPAYDMVRQWLKHAVQEIQVRVGQPGEFSSRVGVFLKATRKRVGRRARKASVAPLPVSPTVLSPVDTRWVQRGPATQVISGSLTSPFRVQPTLNAA